ncbi:nuclear transport factor 2 family protein [Alkalimonas sp. NCh-2]|uniref:YybH family protein n=1 Tax=Alkalimonas sp. NCh-2 TaxID=3144846 RepID=UPI0031F69649
MSADTANQLEFTSSLLPFTAPALQQSAEQLLQKLQQAVNQRDLTALASCYAEQAMLVNILGQRLSGRQQIVDYFSGSLELHRDEYLSYALVHAMAVNNDCAVLNVKQQCISHLDNRPTGISTAPLWVIHRQAGDWQILACNSV